MEPSPSTNRFLSIISQNNGIVCLLSIVLAFTLESLCVHASRKWAGFWSCHFQLVSWENDTSLRRGTINSADGWPSLPKQLERRGCVMTCNDVTMNLYTKSNCCGVNTCSVTMWSMVAVWILYVKSAGPVFYYKAPTFLAHRHTHVQDTCIHVQSLAQGHSHCWESPLCFVRRAVYYISLLY